MKLRSRSSRATGPKMRVPRGFCAVSISTEFRQEKETNGNTLLSERVYGKASRAIRLPQPVDANAASAKHVDGVLQLTLPKKSVSNGARLTIN